MSKQELIISLYGHMCGQYRNSKLIPILNYINGRPTYITVIDNECDLLIVSIKIVAFTRPTFGNYTFKVTDLITGRFLYTEIYETLND